MEPPSEPTLKTGEDFRVRFRGRFSPRTWSDTVKAGSVRALSLGGYPSLLIFRRKRLMVRSVGGLARLFGEVNIRVESESVFQMRAQQARNTLISRNASVFSIVDGVRITL